MNFFVFYYSLLFLMADELRITLVIVIIITAPLKKNNAILLYF